MENTYFTDAEYRLLLAALGREEKICKKVDSESSGEPTLTSVLRNIKVKIAKVQYQTPVSESLVKLGWFGLDTWGYLILRGAVCGEIYPECIISEIFDYCGVLVQSLKVPQIRITYKEILVKELYEGTYLDNALKTDNFAEIFSGYVKTFLTETVECDEDDADIIANLYQEMIADKLRTETDYNYKRK